MSMALKDANHGKSWSEWEEGHPEPEDRKHWKKPDRNIKPILEFYGFEQYELFADSGMP